MMGSVFRRPTGWAYRVDLGPDPVTGKRRQRQRGGFRTKRLAEDALALERGRVVRGAYGSAATRWTDS